MAYVKVLDCTTNSHVHNLTKYITQPEKTLNGLLVFCNGCNENSIVKDFEMVRNQYYKNKGVLTHQIIQSFKRSEVTAEEAHEIAKELAERTLHGYQYVITTHVDAKEVINTHIELNSVSYLTGMKFCNNKSSLAIIRKASDDICLEHGLSVIAEKPHLKGIDKKTYEAAMRGGSWKVNLVNDLDNLLKSCKSKKDLIYSLEKLGYKIKETEKHITVFKEGFEKGIRLNTLAKQFGSQYTKHNIENHFEGKEIDRTEVLNNHTKADDRNSEWQKYERHYFKNYDNNIRKNVMSANAKLMFKLERSISNSHSLSMMVIRQIVFMIFYLNRENRKEYKKAKEFISRPKNKHYQINEVKTPIERQFGNVSYKTITQTYGETLTLKVPLTKVIEFEKMNIFYSGIFKANGDAFITFKKIHGDYVSQKLGVDIDLIHTKNELRQERMKNKQMKNKASVLKENIYNFTVTNVEVKRLDELGLDFSFISCKNGYKISFLESDCKVICEALGKDYSQEKIAFEKMYNNKKYAELKFEVKNNPDDKIIYRVVDKDYADKIKANFDWKYACFEKDSDKVNIAFLQSNEDKYKRVVEEERNHQLDKQQQEQGQKRTRGISL